MQYHPSHAAVLMLVALSSSLSAQVSKTRPDLILKQPLLPRTEYTAARSQMKAMDPLAALTITPSPAAPNLPSPSFEAKSLNVPAGAHNDAQGKIVRTNLNLTGGENQACPITVMFTFGTGVSVPAAGWYPTTASTAPAHERYPFLYGGAYFRPPAVPDGAFPGGVPSPPQTKNSWVHLVNCRNEYSNALPFRIEPTKFQITKVWPAAFIGGQQVVVSGSGLEGLISCGSAWCAPTQKVMFHFKLGKNNQSNTGLDIVERDLEGPLWNGSSLDERAVNLFAPSLEGQGYTKASWVLMEASVYVMKGTARSNSLPIRYCSSAANTSIASGSCW
jgi:hypothetical protein